MLLFCVSNIDARPAVCVCGGGGGYPYLHNSCVPVCLSNTYARTYTDTENTDRYTGGSRQNKEVVGH